VDGAQVKNIYVFNTLLNMLGQDAQPGDLVGLTLRQGLQTYFATPAQADERRPWPRLFILDQFEELFTTHPDRYRERADFFLQLQRCLADYPQLSLLFVMREDYIAHLDSHAAQMPDRLRTRFRMERLRYEAALPAVKEPAARAGRPFAEGVAEALVDNLRQIQLGRPREGTAAAQSALGTYVEPVHLQIVCQQLWAKLPPDRTAILAKDVQEFGDVDQALIGFYEDALRQVIKQTEISERRLRTWFDTQLITPARTRGLVFRGTSQTEGLPNAAVDILYEAYIIRADIRGGDTWYELAHDRLVEPILAANRAWQATYYNPLAAARQAWLEAGRNPENLLDGVRLKEALAYADDHPHDVIEEEREFLAESTRQALQAARRRRNMIIATVSVIFMLALLTTWALFSARQAQHAEATAVAEAARALNAQATAKAEATRALNAEATAVAEATRALNAQAIAKAEATRALNAEATAVAEATRALNAEATAVAESDRADWQAQIALSRQLAAQALNLLDNQFDLALLLNLEAYRIANTVEARSNLLFGLEHAPRLTTFLRNHTEWVLSVAFSPDGKTLASGSADDTIILWDIANRRPLGPPLTGHIAGVWSVAFSPDGKTLASGSSDRTIILWDVASRQPLDLPLRGHTAAVRSVTFSPNGQILASGDANGKIILWDVASRQPLDPPLTGHTDVVWGAAFSPDNQTLASGSADGKIILWDLTSSPPLRSTLTSHTDGVRSVAFSLDGKTLASGSADDTIILWDVASRQPLGPPLTGHTDIVWSVAFSPDGQTLASASRDKKIILWDIAASRKLLDQPFTGHTAEVRSVTFSPDGQTLASGGSDNTIILWSVPARQRLGQSLTDHTDWVWSVAFSPDSRMLASSDANGKIILWDVASRRQLDPPLTGHRGGVFSVTFSPDGQTLASGGWDKTIILWDVASRQPLGPPLTGHTAEVFSVTFSPDGQTLASGGSDNTIILWDVASRQPLGPPLTDHTNWVWSVAFSPDGQTLASASRDNTIILWDLTNSPSLSHTLTGHTSSVTSVAFSPDTPDTGRKILASSDANGKIILWDVASHRRLGQPLTGHTGVLRGVAFSPDGTTLASAGDDATVILWDVASRQPLGQPLTGHTAEVFSVTFSPDGQTLASGGWDNTIILWDLNFESWQARICDIVGRNLTWTEWEQYLPQQPYRAVCPGISLYFFEALNQAVTYALAGDTERASTAFEKVVESAIEANHAKLSNSICWRGSINRFPEIVLPACEQAVELAPDYEKGWYHHNRGLARALMGDYGGAIEDFQFFVEWSKENDIYEQYSLTLEAWITELKAGRNPFDEATLEELRW
jgi:WD40 repeat protein